MKVRTCAIVVSHGNAGDTIDCVASLSASEAPVKIVIVDNDAGGNPQLQRAPVTSADVEILKSRDNLGFSRGCNLGIEWAMQHTDCEFFLLLHNDTFVQPDAVVLLEDAMDEHPEAGLATGRIVFREDPARLYFGRGTISWRHGGSKVPHFGRNAMSTEVLRSGTVDCAPECAMFLRREVLDRTGGLDETFFMYEEGVDLSLRVSRNGHKIFYGPEAVILHRGHGVPGKHGLSFHDRWSASVPGYDFRIYHMVRNSVINARKHARGSGLVAFAALYPFFVLWKSIKASRKLGFRAFSPVWRGFRAGLGEHTVRPHR